MFYYLLKFVNSFTENVKTTRNSNFLHYFKGYLTRKAGEACLGDFYKMSIKLWKRKTTVSLKL